MLSRVADSLYWMSRYLERAQHTARLIDVNLVLMLDQSPGFMSRRWRYVLESLRTASPPEPLDDARMIADRLTFSREHKGSIVASIAKARDNASQVRQQISSEMWEQLNRLYLHTSGTRIDDVWNTQPHAFFRSVIDAVQLFEGITSATMNRGEGWYFIELGRYLERAAETAALLQAQWHDAQQDGGSARDVTDYLGWVSLLKSRTAFEAYCQVYTADLRPDRVAEFLLLNDEFPQTIRFAATKIHAAVRAVGQKTGALDGAIVERLAGRLQAELDFARIDELLVPNLHTHLEDIQRQCQQIHAELHRIYLAPPIESLLRQ
ncbi:MAG: alpha-E domain-containing protein [Chloroflexota bacterium]|nr:alpha-E domain-containing protein [Chloroflexota bacterium]